MCTTARAYATRDARKCNRINVLRRYARAASVSEIDARGAQYTQFGARAAGSLRA